MSPEIPPPHPMTADEPVGWPEDAVRERLIGDWHFWQRRRGHRTSTDDLITAWMAVDAVGGARPARYLDLGCGIGSVLLMTAHRLRPGGSIGVEAQAQSVALATRSVAELGDAPPIRIVHGDLRGVTVDELGVFDLVTGSPPYLPVGTAVPSADSQRRACRLELRGGVEDYCLAAARVLAPTGRFALVFQTAWQARVHGALADAGLHLVEQVDLEMRAGSGTPFLSVFAAAKSDPGRPAGRRALAVRDASGTITPAYAALRRELGVDG